MVIDVTFCDVDDLEEITGLTHNELWKNGFNLDDCDAVMIIDEKDLSLKKVETLTYANGTPEYKWVPEEDIWDLYWTNKISRGLYDILDNWENYCAGCWYTKYNGKVYISKHHA